MKKLVLAVALVFGMVAVPASACPIHGTAGGNAEGQAMDQLFSGVETDGLDLSWSGNHEFSVQTTKDGATTTYNSQSNSLYSSWTNGAPAAINDALDLIERQLSLQMDGETYAG